MLLPNENFLFTWNEMFEMIYLRWMYNNNKLGNCYTLNISNSWSSFIYSNNIYWNWISYLYEKKIMLVLMELICTNISASKIIIFNLKQRWRKHHNKLCTEQIYFIEISNFYFFLSIFSFSIFLNFKFFFLDELIYLRFQIFWFHNNMPLIEFI